MKRQKIILWTAGLFGLLATELFAGSLFDETKLKAEQGVAEAQYLLGLMYTNGEGVLENYVEAYAWWLNAQMNGSSSAREGIKILKQKLTPSQIAAREVRAKEISKMVERKMR